MEKYTFQHYTWLQAILVTLLGNSPENHTVVKHLLQGDF